jgi:hypothetical protein
VRGGWIDVLGGARPLVAAEAESRGWMWWSAPIEEPTGL